MLCTYAFVICQILARLSLWIITRHQATYTECQKPISVKVPVQMLRAHWTAAQARLAPLLYHGFTQCAQKVRSVVHQSMSISDLLADSYSLRLRDEDYQRLMRRTESRIVQITHPLMATPSCFRLMCLDAENLIFQYCPYDLRCFVTRCKPHTLEN